MHGPCHRLEGVRKYQRPRGHQCRWRHCILCTGCQEIGWLIAMAQQTMLFSDAQPETVPAAIVSPPTGDMLRDDGIRRAAEHADLCIPSWTDRALRFVSDYPESVF